MADHDDMVTRRERELAQVRRETAERIAQAIEECPHHVTCSIQLHVNNPRRRCTCHIEPLARIAREHADLTEPGEVGHAVHP